MIKNRCFTARARAVLEGARHQRKARTRGPSSGSGAADVGVHRGADGKDAGDFTVELPIIVARPTLAACSPTMAQRTVFFISDGTGITAETFGNSIMSQFAIKSRHLRR